MGSLMRIACALTVLVGLTVGIAYCQPGWLADLGMDVWKLPEMNQLLNKETNRGEKLDQELTRFQDLSKQKNQLIQDLANGNISLAEAITTLNQMDDGDTLELALSVLDIQQSQTNGGIGRLLIFWVQDYLKDQPDRAEAVFTRLDEELEELETITQ